MTPEQIAQGLRLHNAWRRGEGVFDSETPTPMPQTPKELGELIEAAAVNCERAQLLAKALREAKDLISYHGQDMQTEAVAAANKNKAFKILNAVLAEAGLQEKVG